MGAPVNQRVTVNTEEIIQGAGRISLNNVELGSFSGGLKLARSQSETWVESDYALGSIDGEVKSADLQLSTELEQATLEHLAEAWNCGGSSSVLSGTSSKTLDLKPDKVLKEHLLTFEGQSATNKALTRVVTIQRAVFIGNSTVPFQRGTKTVIPITIKCLLNSTGSWGTIVENTKA